MQTAQVNVQSFVDNKDKLIETGLFTEKTFQQGVEDGFQGADPAYLSHLIAWYLIIEKFLNIRDERILLEMEMDLTIAMDNFDVDLTTPSRNNGVTPKYLLKMARMYCEIRNRYNRCYKRGYDAKVERMLEFAENML